MRVFKTLQDLLNYIPNCIVCGKHMKLSIEGYVNAVSPSKPRWSSRNKRIYLKTELKDGVLRCKHENHSVAIEAPTNKLLEGEDIVNRLMLNTINVKTCCPTCVFKSMCVYQAGNTKKTHYFPPVALRTEELSYTMRGGKHCMITKHYMFNDKEETKCFIIINNISLQPVPLDFAKFTSLEQVNKKVKTIAVFQ